MFSKIHQILNNQNQKLPTSNQVQLQINNTLYDHNNNNYVKIETNQDHQKTTKNQPHIPKINEIVYVDGGQAILASGANFSLSFIRIAAYIQPLEPATKPSSHMREYFLLTIPKWTNNKFYFENHIFEHINTTQIITPPCKPEHLHISTDEKSITTGTTSANPQKITDIARRLSELQLIIDLEKRNASKSSLYVIDGTLTPTYPHESTYIEKLPQNICSIAKSSTLLTTVNQPITHFLNQHGPNAPWIYTIHQNLHFTKLHEKSNHIFRAEGDIKNIIALIPHSKDAIFPGYPYGLIKVDQIARVTNEEKRILTIKFLNHKENSIVKSLLATQDSHTILDSIR